MTSEVLGGKSIATEYFGPGNTRGARIKASVIDGDRIQKSISVSYPHELNTDEAHLFAAEKMRDKMGWSGDLIGVGTRKGYVFGFKAFSNIRRNPSPRPHRGIVAAVTTMEGETLATFTRKAAAIRWARRYARAHRRRLRIVDPR